MWPVFREHHYLNTKKLGAGMRCYVAKHGDKPVAFIAVLRVHMKMHYYRVSRVVVLPDYQGVGVGKSLLNFIAEHFRLNGLPIPFKIVTSNPQFVRGLKGWRVKRFGHGGWAKNSRRTEMNQELMNSNSKQRLSASLEYVGEPKP